MSYFIGYSKNNRLRQTASSGGVVSEILIYLLEKKLVDVALIYKMDITRLVPIAARSRQDIIEGCQSKYLDIDIRQVKTFLEKIVGRVAVVGLPCQVKAIRKSASSIMNKVAFIFGLYCGGTVTAEGMRHFYKKLGVTEKNIKDVKFRDGIGNGCTTVTTFDGVKKSVSKDAFNYLFAFYKPGKCKFCKDFFAEQSDISFGDCWIKKQYTSILVRKEENIDLLKSIAAIELEELSEKDFFAQHRHSINLKRKNMDVSNWKAIVETLPFPVISILVKLTKILRRYV